MKDHEKYAAELETRAYGIEKIGILERIHAAQMLRGDTFMFINRLLVDMRSLLNELEGRKHGC